MHLYILPARCNHASMEQKPGLACRKGSGKPRPKVRMLSQDSELEEEQGFPVQEEQWTPTDTPTLHPPIQKKIKHWLHF